MEFNDLFLLKQELLYHLWYTVPILLMGETFMKNRKIKEQLLIWFLIFTLIPLFIISSWCYLLSSEIINKKSGSYVVESIQQLSDNTDQMLIQVENISLAIAYNNYVQDMLETARSGQEIDRKDSYQLEKNMILNYDYSSMRDIAIRTENSKTNSGQLFRVPARIEQNIADVLYPYSEDIISAPIWRSDPENQVIQMIRPIDSTSDFQRIGTLYISLYGSYIDNLVRNIHFDEKGFALILDESLNPINIKTVPPKFLSGIEDELSEISGVFKRSIDNVDYRYFYTTSKKTGWKTLGIISVSDLHSQVRMLGFAVFFGVLSISLIAIFTASRLSRSFSDKIHMVTDAMKKASEGDFSVHLPESLSENEFYDLNAGFNHMVQKINSLIHTVYQAELLKTEAEYAALQAQMNPHFLYNTLDTICWQAKLAQNEEIFETTYSLASLLRASMSNPNPYVTVKEELTYINDYIQIQKARYRDKIHAEVAVESQLLTCQIPKLILQPVVENAFVHGLEEKEGPGTVTIQGILNEDEHIMVFRIHDDGIGMTKAQTENILNIVPRKKGGFGISSVQKRIQLLYGKEYGINILSQPGKGTTVIIRIPAKE